MAAVDAKNRAAIKPPCILAQEVEIFEQYQVSPEIRAFFMGLSDKK
jgi:hypothetical protein